MRTRRWTGWLAITVLALGVLTGHRMRADAHVAGGTPAQQQMARWAAGRFAAGDLTLPPLEIRFHRDRSGCHGRLGYYEDGAANICGIHVNPMSRRTLLHEMAHGWVESHVSAGLRDRFLRLRQLETWNDQRAEWEERGTEHAAEIISWAIHDQGTGILLPSIPRNSVEELADGYELLTGHALPSMGSPPHQPGPSVE